MPSLDVKQVERENRDYRDSHQPPIHSVWFASSWRAVGALLNLTKPQHSPRPLQNEAPMPTTHTISLYT